MLVDRTVFVVVEGIKRVLQFLLRMEFLLLHGSNDKLRILDGSIVVKVSGLVQLRNLRRLESISKEFFCACCEFCFCKRSTIICIKGVENCKIVFPFFFGHQLLRDERIGSFLEVCLGLEFSQVCESLDGLLSELALL